MHPSHTHSALKDAAYHITIDNSYPHILAFMGGHILNVLV